MSKTATAQTPEVLSFRRWFPDASASAAPPSVALPAEGGNTYLIGVQSGAMSKTLEAVVPLLGRLLSERTAQVRERKLGELIDFLAGQMVVPSAVDTQMAQRLVERHARVLNEFGFVTAEELADANQSRAANRHVAGRQCADRIRRHSPVGPGLAPPVQQH